MPKIFNFSGEDGFLRRDSMETDRFLSVGGHNMDVYFPACKRSRICAPFLVGSSQEVFEQRQPSIEILPDECLFEIFRRLPSAEARSASACVSKHWLMILSSVHADETFVPETENSFVSQERSIASDGCELVGSESKETLSTSGCNTEVGENDIIGDGYLSRCLEGKKATDVRLAAIAIGVQSRGGLGKLSIRGSKSGLTDFGLKAIARGCPSLKTLSLWNVSTISDEGIIAIANGCRLLEKLDLCNCPMISDKSVVAIAKNCPSLSSLIVESCSSIGNESLKAIGHGCPNLRSITLKNCSGIQDQGVENLFPLVGAVVTKLKLEGLNISDKSLGVIGRFCVALTDLALSDLQQVSEKGFWVMGNCKGLVNLQSFTVTACRGVTDLGLVAVGHGSPNLKRVCIRKCSFVSDNGLVFFSKAAGVLESFQLEECHRITQSGIFGILMNCGMKLKALAITNCFGIRDLVAGNHSLTPCLSLRSLSISNCPGFGNASLATLGKLCPSLVHVDFNALTNINDEGLLSLVENSEAGLVKVKLSGCVNLTDEVASAIAKLHGGTLELLKLDGCGSITDATLWSIAEYCSLLSELDVSKSKITDAGIAALASNAVQLSLRVLSLSGCSSVSEKSFPSLERLGEHLAGLNIQNCRRISTSAVDLLEERLYGCDILYWRGSCS